MTQPRYYNVATIKAEYKNSAIKGDNMNLIELDKASLSTVPFDKVMYLSIAERGAMGCPGKIKAILHKENECIH